MTDEEIIAILAEHGLSSGAIYAVRACLAFEANMRASGFDDASMRRARFDDDDPDLTEEERINRRVFNNGGRD